MPVPFDAPPPGTTPARTGGIDATKRQRLRERGSGFVFWNPDTGEEYAPDHPKHSGEVPDAERIRRSTPQEDLLWQQMQERFQEVLQHEARVAALTAELEAARKREEAFVAALRRFSSLIVLPPPGAAVIGLERWFFTEAARLVAAHDTQAQITTGGDYGG